MLGIQHSHMRRRLGAPRIEVERTFEHPSPGLGIFNDDDGSAFQAPEIQVTSQVDVSL